MVSSWSPEPPQDEGEEFSPPHENIAVESDESGDEGLGLAPPGYELLPQAPYAAAESEEEEHSDTDIAGATGFNNPVSDPTNAVSVVSGRRRSEVEEEDRLFSAPDLQPELAVDCDRVRAAMSGFSLPPSAIPPWARDIPEAQWEATLTQHIRRIQGTEPHGSQS